MNAGKNIIVVDDDPSIQDAVRIMLERKGYGITIFGSGERLLIGEFDHPDLFIVDKQLPGVDGLDVCRFLKSQDATKDIPVLILSASPHAGRLAKAACANEFLEKPFKMQALRDAVERLIA